MSIHVFGKFMEEKYYDRISSLVNSYLISNKKFLSSHTVPSVSRFELEAIHIEGVTFNIIDGNDIEFSLSVLSDVSIYGKSRFDYESDSISVWNTIRCTATLKCGLHNLCFNPAQEYSKAKFDKERKLNQFLVPYLSSDDADRVAENFLHKYCPSVLDNQIPVPVYEIVTKMGLKMYYAPLDCNMFGQTYFDSAVVTVYTDLLTRKTSQITITAGTILINPDVYFYRNIGTVNNTIIHECIHWDRHRLFFELQKLLNNEYKYISCKNIEGIKSLTNSPLDWIEWQANTLAPKILLPATTVKKFIGEHLYAYRRDLPPNTRDAEIMEMVIQDTANYFHVSILAAKLRAIELGFEQARGVFVYIDGKYISSFAFASKSMGKSGSFVIDSISALRIIVMNPTLYQLYNDRRIVFVNNMLCINKPKYIEINSDGRYTMTSYALDHVNECCFLFNCKTMSDVEYDTSYYRTCFLCREVSADSFIEASYSITDGNNELTEKEAKEMELLLSQTAMMADTFDDLPGSFHKTVDYHINRKGLTEEELSYRSQISTQTLSELRNKKDKKVEFKTLIKFCMGLNLPFDYCEDLMKKAQIGFPPGQEGLIFKWLLREHTDESLERCQVYLNAAKINVKLYDPSKSC